MESIDGRIMVMELKRLQSDGGKGREGLWGMGEGRRGGVEGGWGLQATRRQYPVWACVECISGNFGFENTASVYASLCVRVYLWVCVRGGEWRPSRCFR